MNPNPRSINDLPDELVAHIISYLEPADIVVFQSISRHSRRLARDGPLWRFKCYHDSPQATKKRRGQKPWSQFLAKVLVGDREALNDKGGVIGETREADGWDLSHVSEKVDWYSEYVARHARLSVSWVGSRHTDNQDVRGVALYEDREGKKVAGPLADGSLAVINLDQSFPTSFRHLRLGENCVRSERGILFESPSSSSANRAATFPGTAEGVSVDTFRHRAYIGVGDILSEIDLNRLQVVSQTRYPCTITAVSEVQRLHQPLTVGTSSGLHIQDPRIPSKNPSSSSSTVMRNGFLYARLEPAPLSILHQAEHSIIAAGRFPSILNYDRRYFPRIEYVIHSGARLSALTFLPFPLRGVTQARSDTSNQGTLISCGEYNGRASLEFYSIARSTAHQNVISSDTISTNGFASSTREQQQPGTPSYQNRQSISPSKLLSVANHGTRIVVSDADGGLRWIERDGRSVVQKWNVNSPQSPHLGSCGRDNPGNNPNDDGAVVRRILPTGPGSADDLLIWTGERVGLVSLGRRNRQEALVEDREQQQQQQQQQQHSLGLDTAAHAQTRIEENDRRKRAQEHEYEYDRQMRRALERQADELNWMQRFGVGGG